MPPRRTPERRLLVPAALLACLAIAPARAGDGPPTLSVRNPAEAAEGSRLPALRGEPIARPGASASGGGWWLGPLGVVLALGAFGALSVLQRRARQGGAAGPIEVVGRVALSPKHAALLVRTGDRTLIVGVGPQGAPSLLGELTAGPEPEGARPLADPVREERGRA